MGITIVRSELSLACLHLAFVSRHHLCTAQYFIWLAVDAMFQLYVPNSSRRMNFMGLVCLQFVTLLVAYGTRESASFNLGEPFVLQSWHL